jgi:ABC-type bacteriocin/lantibiotic exporter with double-glycine peptidase domain
MNAVERILEYTNLEREESSVTATGAEAAALAKELRQRGTPLGIKYDTVGLAHNADLRAVVQSLTLDIPAGQKVALVGRSGSGKSTMLMGLVRVARVIHGRITVGGVDIARLPLRQLRRIVWTVPQDVTLFW